MRGDAHRALVGCLLAFVAMAPHAAAMPLERYRGDRALEARVWAIAHSAAERYLRTGEVSEPDAPALDRRLRVPGGVFVTYSRDGHTRGCWGSLNPTRPTLGQEIAAAAVGALRQDYRHRPIGLGEWPSLRMEVSLVGAPVPVEEASELAPMREGVLLRAGDRAGLLLPGEARTVRRALYECRRKAGVGPRTPVSLYRFPAWTVGPRRTP